MVSRFLLVGVASLTLACAIALVFLKLSSPSDNRNKVKTRNVVVASIDLPPGAKIRSQDIRIASIPEEILPQNCIEKLDDANDRVVTSAILKGEPIVHNRLAARGSTPGLGPMIPPGFRAVSVRVNDVIGVAGFIQPGMHVDVLATGHLPNSQESVTRTVLQNVAVLSAGQVLQPEPKGQVINAQVVTLQVRPEEAEVLALTSGEGRIQLVLRNSSDTAVGITPGAYLTAVYNHPTGPTARPVSQAAINRHFEKLHNALPPAVVSGVSPVTPSLSPRSVEVIRGTIRSDVQTPGETEKNREQENKKVTSRPYAP